MKIKAYSELQRKLGFIEGVTSFCGEEISDAIINAIIDIDEILDEELLFGNNTKTNDDNVCNAHWNKDPVTGHTNCSNCKAPLPGDAELKEFYESDYCPCCGARMQRSATG